MAFDAALGKMLCPNCEHTMEVPTAEGQTSIVEYNLQDGIAASAERGLGTPVRTARCNDCGATVSFAENVTATECEFCGSSQVMEQEENRNLIRPESLVPFKIEKSEATGKFKSWIGGLWFRPSALKERAAISKIHGVYVPYWTYDATVDSEWQAQAGFYYYVTESYTDSEGNDQTRQVRETRWEPAWGDRRDAYDDLLVCASKGLPPGMAERLETFDTSALVSYDPSYLTGWSAEEYAVELNDGWTQAVARMESTQRDRCSSDVPGDTQRFLNVTNQFSEETFKHVLLPLWISAYRYNDKVYRFLVNGQTGEVTGKAPYSWLKIVLFIAAIVGTIAAIVVFATR